MTIKEAESLTEILQKSYKEIRELRQVIEMLLKSKNPVKRQTTEAIDELAKNFNLSRDEALYIFKVLYE